MATGIISNAFFLQTYRPLSDVLFAIAIVTYLWLGLLTIVRAVRFGSVFWADLVNPCLVFSFLTIVAATDVLGVGLEMRGFATVALAMWLAALGLWAVLIYFGFGVLAFHNTPGQAQVVDGGWLIAIVGTQSLVILGAHVGPWSMSASAPPLLAQALWAVGLALYAIYVTLLSYRLFFFNLRPGDVGPLLWVVMGAAAISANAGSTLMATSSEAPFPASVQPFIAGMTIAMWGWATWWIPLLLLFGIWKHVVRKIPIHYTPILWSIVFPLGMYAVASLRLGMLADAPFPHLLSREMAWIALAAWALSGAGLIISLRGRGRALVRSSAVVHRH